MINIHGVKGHCPPHADPIVRGVGMGGGKATAHPPPKLGRGDGSLVGWGGRLHTTTRGVLAGRQLGTFAQHRAQHIAHRQSPHSLHLT